MLSKWHFSLAFYFARSSIGLALKAKFDYLLCWMDTTYCTYIENLSAALWKQLLYAKKMQKTWMEAALKCKNVPSASGIIFKVQKSFDKSMKIPNLRWILNRISTLLPCDQHDWLPRTKIDFFHNLRPAESRYHDHRIAHCKCKTIDFHPFHRSKCGNYERKLWQAAQ